MRNPPTTTARIERQIRDNEDWQADLRREIERMPPGTARELKIDLLMRLHKDNIRLCDLALRD